MNILDLNEIYEAYLICKENIDLVKEPTKSFVQLLVKEIKEMEMTEVQVMDK